MTTKGDVTMLVTRRSVRARLSALEAYVGMTDEPTGATPTGKTPSGVTPAGMTHGEFNLLLAFHADIRYAYAEIRNKHAEIVAASRRSKMADASRPPINIEEMGERFLGVCEEIKDLLRPLIAAAHGSAKGAGPTPDGS